MTLPSSGEPGNRIRYKSRNKWGIDTGGTERVEVADATTTIRNDLAVTGDLNAAGGFAQSFTFAKLNLLQGTFAGMTASFLSGAEGGGDFATAYSTYIPMVRPGSVRGLAIAAVDGHTIKSGAFSASVTINGANVACTVAAHTGAYGSGLVQTVAKDTAGLTFTAGQVLGVTLTASADYLSEPGVTSASFVATVLVEM